MKRIFRQFAILLGIGWAAANLSAEAPPAATLQPEPTVLAHALGVACVKGSSSTLLVERQGKKYLVDLAAQTIAEVAGTSAPASATSALQPSQPARVAAQAMAATPATKKPTAKVYEPGDDYVFTLPTGRRLDRHGFYVDFNHRFAYEPTFSGPAKGATLLGLDSWSLPTFGFRYGVTDKLSVSVLRSSSWLGRPIELMAAYNLLDERDGQPFNAAFRFSVDGQDHFSNNFSYNFEGVFSRTLFSRAQFYIVPTVTLQNRRLVSNAYANPVPDLPGINSFSLGLGGAIDIRPTVALVAEVIPTLVNGPELGIHRPPYSFGIQKKIFRHAFTFGFTTGPGTAVAQRAGTVATFINRTYADTPSGLFIGFDLTRQVY